MRIFTCELDVELVLWFEDLDVEGAVGSKVLYRPGSEDGLVVLREHTHTQTHTHTHMRVASSLAPLIT